jgi:hypothetical protein
MRDHHTPSIRLSELCAVRVVSVSARTDTEKDSGRGKRDVRLDTLADSPDLVHFEEQTIARLLLNGGLDADGVGNGKIISNDLENHASRERVRK